MEALERVKEWLDSKTNLKHVYRRLQLAARFLIVGTFADDAIRVTCDYGGQISTMVSVGFPSAAATVMPAVFIVTQATGVFLVLSGRAPEQGCMTLLVWTAIHPFLYLQQKNLEFLLESVTIIGGLLILLSSERNLRKRQEAIELQARPGERAALVGGDEEVAEQREEAQEQTDRLQLGGRVAVSAVFVYYVVKMLHERIGVLKGVVPEELHVAVVEGVLLVLLLIATGLLVVGMKARWCALLLAVTMFLAALYKHPWVRRRRRAGCAAAAARPPARPPACPLARPACRAASAAAHRARAAAAAVCDDVVEEDVRARLRHRVRGRAGRRVAVLRPPALLLLPADLDGGRAPPARRPRPRPLLARRAGRAGAGGDAHLQGNGLSRR